MCSCTASQPSPPPPPTTAYLAQIPIASVIEQSRDVVHLLARLALYCSLQFCVYVAHSAFTHVVRQHRHILDPSTKNCRAGRPCTCENLFRALLHACHTVCK